MAMTTGSCGDLGRRERKKRQTRVDIQAHALRLFAERGFEETTIQDITEAADVAKRTFFLHFSSKEEVLLGSAKARVCELLAEIARRPESENAYAAARESLRVFTHVDEGERELVMLRARLLEQAPSLKAADMENFAAIERALVAEAARRSGLDAERDLYPSLLAAGVFTAVRVGFTLWYRRGGTGPVVESILAAFDALAPALDVPRPVSARSR